MKREVYLFGYGEQGKSLASTLNADFFKIHIVESSHDRCEQANRDGYYDVTCIDIVDDLELESLQIAKDTYAVCVMDDEHLNVFLVLSLRSIYPDATIIAISNSIYTTQKLKMAGADRIIDIYKVSAYRIHNMLLRPVATKLLDSFVTDDSEISFREFVVPEFSFLHGKMATEINFSIYGVLLVGMLDVELGNKFIFITSGIDHKIDSGDTLVCMGYNDDLDKFATIIQEKDIL